MTNNAERKALFGEDVAVMLTALEDTSDAIVVYAYDIATKSLRIVHVNEVFTRQTGYSAQEAVGKRPGDFPALPPSQPAQDRMIAALEKDPSVELELVSYRKGSSDLWDQLLLRPIRDSSGRTTHWLAVEAGASAPFTPEQRLQTENFKLTRVISIARRLSATLDGRELLERLRTGIRQLTGAEATLYAPRSDGCFALTEDLEPPAHTQRAGDELIARAGSGEWDVIDFARTRAAIAVTSTGCTPSFVIEVRARERQVLRQSDVSAVRLLAQYFAVPARNVKLYAELNALRASAIELNELKSDLIAMLAHDFNGPLTTIIGFAQILADEPAQSEEDREGLHTIARAASRLAHLAADTLALSSLEHNASTLTFASVDIVALVRDVAISLEGRTVVRVTSDLQSAFIAADESRMRQVFYNIIDNAIKYSPEAPQVDVFIKQKKDQLHIDVVDFGIGIPVQEIKSLFARFARASNARKLGIAGTGFGLYLVRTILENHGGQVSVLQGRERGTAIRISLPLGAHSGEPPAYRVLTCEAPSNKRSFLAHTLRSTGFEVTPATCSKQLFDRLTNGDYDYLIIDAAAVTLSDGEIKRLEKLSAEKNFKVIALSADGHTVSEHFTSLLQPFLTADLLATVRRAHAKKREVVRCAKRSAGSS